MSLPKCFLLYNNYFETPGPLCKYVDNTTVFEVCDRKFVIQESFNVAAMWTEHNYKTIYQEISKKMIISFAQDDNFNLRNAFANINIGGSDVDQADRAKLPCVAISQDLTRNKRMGNMVKQKAKKRLDILYQLRRAELTKSYRKGH